MLQHLYIRDFAIVPSLDQDFQPGFTAISGETGAGKSILVDALTLLLGARSDSSWVRPGADRAELTAEFSLPEASAARVWLSERDLDDDDTCLLRRSIQASGRSRAWVNGTPVTVGQLSELGHRLVEVHGQNEHVRLTRSGAQRALLDASGAYETQLGQVTAAHDDWRAAQAELQQLAEGADLSPAELEYLQFQHQELQQHALEPEALEALEREHRLLSASGALLEALQKVTLQLDGETDSATRQLTASAVQLAEFKKLDPEIEDAAAMIEVALINAQEAASLIENLSSRTDLDPKRLQTLDQQLAALGDLARKHGVELDDLPDQRDQLESRIERARRFDEIRDKLTQTVQLRLDEYRKVSRALSRQRSALAKKLSAQVQKLMAELGMEGGKFRIGISHDANARPTDRGNDDVLIEVSANPGMPLAPLSKVASGGELSRISLAIKVVTADGANRTQVFDEIDAGVGGDTANAVGQLLKQTAQHGQALCVTHLAQVAVRADQQIKITKSTRKDRPALEAEVLKRDHRVEEIARMLGGKVSDQSRAHAREMLEATSG